MIELTDFVDICRLCLTKHDNHPVNLFSIRNISESNEEPRKFRVVEIVEPFCNIKIRKGDGLPECICIDCWNTIVLMQKLQIESLKADQLLNEILNSQSTVATVKDEERSDEIVDIKIEFVDTQLDVQKQLLTRSRALLEYKTDTTELTVVTEQKINNAKSEKRRRDNVKRKYVKGAEKKISCEVCGTLVAYNLIEFHLNAHNDIRPYKCKEDGCEKYFTAPQHARQHHRKCHIYNVTRPYVCDICGKGFVQTSSLITHRSYHFDPEIPCLICGQKYRNKRALQRHSPVHSGERAFPCTECSKSFQTSFTLKTHMRIHTNEKPFSCSECTKAFAYKCLLKAHIEKYHPKESR